jgi:uncharacterized membrane protein
MGLSVPLAFIMAGAIVIGLAIFIAVVLRADRRSKRADPAQPQSRHQEVMGGRFDATGGRQVMPRRDEPPAELDDEVQSRESRH